MTKLIASPPSDRRERLRSLVPGPLRDGLFNIGWAGLTQVVGMVVRLASNLILTRLLAPEVYGLFGTAIAVISTLDCLADLGVLPALIRHPEGASPRFLNTGWWINLFRGAFMWLILMMIARPLSHYYAQPELFLVLLALSTRPFVQTLRSPGYPLLRRNLNFRALFFDEISQTIVASGVSVAVAWHTHSIWAIVVGTLAGTLIGLMNSYIFCPMAPRRLWDAEVAREISLLSRQIFVNTLVMTVWMNLDRLLGLKFVKEREMGFYTVAFGLATIIETMMLRGCDVYFSMLSRCTDLEQRERWQRKVSHRIATWGMPVLAFGIVLAPLVIRILYDRRYAGAKLLFAILIGRLMVRSLGQIQYQYLLSLAQVRINTKAYFVAMLFQAAIFVPFVTLWRATGMAFAALLSASVLTGVQYLIAYRKGIDGMSPYLVTLGWIAAGLLVVWVVPWS